MIKRKLVELLIELLIERKRIEIILLIEGSHKIFKLNNELMFCGGGRLGREVLEGLRRRETGL